MFEPLTLKLPVCSKYLNAEHIKNSKRWQRCGNCGLTNAFREDFCTFMTSRYPDVLHLAEFTRSHAEEYLAEIRTNGRFCKEKSFHSSSFRKFLACHSTDRLSPTTWNHYLKLCQSVFARLKGDTGLRNNPFALPIQKTTPESRAAFTLGELYRIGENLNEFVRPIFITGIFSGFSEGDICLLK